MSLSDLIALLPDNTTGAITAGNMRTIVTELYTPTPTKGVAAGPFSNLPIATTFASLPAPGPVTASLTLDEATTILVFLGAYIDSGANNNVVDLGLDLSGATVIAVGSKLEEVIQVGGKSWIQMSLQVVFAEPFAVGTTNFDVRYKATVAGANISNIALMAVRP